MHTVEQFNIGRVCRRNSRLNLRDVHDARGKYEHRVEGDQVRPEDGYDSHDSQFLEEYDGGREEKLELKENNLNDDRRRLVAIVCQVERSEDHGKLHRLDR